MEEHAVVKRRCNSHDPASRASLRFRRLALACLLVATLACTSAWAEESGPPSILVRGKAEISAPPDVARFRVEIKSEDQDAKNAAKDNALRSKSVSKALAKALGSHGTISTASYAVSPRYRWNEGQQILIGYQVRNSLQVEASDLERVGALADAALAAGADAIAAMTFTMKDPTSLSAEALALAATRAKEKADAIAASLGLEVVRILRVEERSAAAHPRTFTQQSVRMADAESNPTPISPGPVDVIGEVEMNVEVRFKK